MRSYAEAAHKHQPPLDVQRVLFTAIPNLWRTGTSPRYDEKSGDPERCAANQGIDFLPSQVIRLHGGASQARTVANLVLGSSGIAVPYWELLEHHSGCVRNPARTPSDGNHVGKTVSACGRLPSGEKTSSDARLGANARHSRIRQVELYTARGQRPTVLVKKLRTQRPNQWRALGTESKIL